MLSTSSIRAAQPILNSYLQNQSAFKPNGCGEIAMTFQYALQQYPNMDILALNAINAFGQISRKYALNQVAMHPQLKKMFPFLRKQYGQHSDLFYYMMIEDK